MPNRRIALHAMGASSASLWAAAWAVPLTACHSSPTKDAGMLHASPSTTPAHVAPNMSPTDLNATIDAAFEFAFPLYEMSRTRFNALDNPANPMRGQVNAVGHRRVLADHRSRTVTTPNNDTLYSSAWLDLSAGPVRIDVAAMPKGRYWSVALMDFYTNHIAVLGSRLDGAGPVQATLVSRQWSGPRPAGRVIEVAGLDVWLLGRWLVDGPHDLAAARAMQDGLRIEPSALAPQTTRAVPRSASDAQNLLAVVNEALQRNPVPAHEGALVERYRAAGVQASRQSGSTDAWALLAEPTRAAWRERMPALHAALQSGIARGSREMHGWRLPPPAIGNFGGDHALRAAVALGGLAALEPAEALYLSRQVDGQGAPLDGAQRYRIRVPAGGVPCEAFWSLSVYERLPDGRLFYADNPIQRYAIGDRTAGLQRAADGSFDIWLQREAPTDAAARAHWLPAPAGPLQLTLRAYVPKPELLQGRAVLPRIERLA